MKMIHDCRVSEILPQKWIWVQKLGFHSNFLALDPACLFSRTHPAVPGVSSGRHGPNLSLCWVWACSWRCSRSFLSANKKYVAVMWLYSFLSSALKHDSHQDNLETITYVYKRTAIYFCMQHPLFPIVPEFHIHLTQPDTATWHDFPNAGLNLTADPLWALFNWTHYKLFNCTSVSIENIKITSHQFMKRTRFNECWSKFTISFSRVNLSSVAETFMISRTTINFPRILLNAVSSTNHQVIKVHYTLSYWSYLNKHFSLTVISW